MKRVICITGYKNTYYYQALIAVLFEDLFVLHPFFIFNNQNLLL